MKASDGATPLDAIGEVFREAADMFENSRPFRAPNAPVGMPYAWPPEADALLGTMSDAQLARRWGDMDSLTIGRRRAALGIPPYREGRRPLYRACVICGTSFLTYGRAARARRTCSPACRGELVRRSLLTAQSRTRLFRRVPGMRFLGFNSDD